MRASRRAFAVLGCIVALSFGGADAFAAVDVMGRFFEKVKDKGFPIAGLAFTDGTAQVDVYKDGEVTRYVFGAEGKVEAVACPEKYDALAIKVARLSAAAAAAAAASQPPEGGNIRSVQFTGTGAGALYVVGVYDKKGKFLGKHRFDVVNGDWEGYEEALGERSPLEKRPQD
ncbi:MAG: hypothetical protein ACYTAN_12970 [Planctomycetota bacterium]|jgi:hypothetical protein